jgi:hypothetical protein
MPKKQVAVSLRKPSQPADIEAFVAGAEPSPPTAKKPAATTPDPLIKHRSREYREMTLYLPADVAQGLSFFCMDHQRDVNGVVSEAVNRYVAGITAVDTPAPNPVAPAHLSLTQLSESFRALWALRPWAH